MGSMYCNSVARDKAPELNSIEFMPKKPTQKDKGRKMIVTMVKIMMDWPCLRVSWACLTASRASITEACCCLRVRMSLSWGGGQYRGEGGRGEDVQPRM